MFFPLPERKGLFEITDLGEAVINDRKCRILRIYPHSDAEPLVEGVFYVDPATGHPVRLVVDRLHHFELLDDNLDGLVELHAQVEYRTLPNGITIPQVCRADGNSRISRYKGFFKIDFLECTGPIRSIPTWCRISKKCRISRIRRRRPSRPTVDKPDPEQP